MLTLLRSLYDDDNILSFLVIPSGKFRLTNRDVFFILNETSRVHEISQLINNTVKDEIVRLEYFKDILSITAKIYSPRFICSHKAEDVLFNILKLDINLDLYENELMKTIQLYIEKGGSLEIDFDSSITDKYQNIIPILDTFKEYH